MIVFLYSFSICSLLVYIKATDFCKLILYTATLVKLFMESRSFWVEFLVSVMYKIVSSVNRDSLTTSFAIGIHLIFSSSLISLTRNSKTMLNRSGESGYPCLLPDFRRNGFFFSPLSMMLARGLS
jgi:hypothetical protein